MAQYSTKIPANVGLTSPLAGGNSGFSETIHKFVYIVGGTPAAVTALPLGVMQFPGTVVGISAQLTTQPSSGSITVNPLKIPYDGASVSVCSTNPAFASTLTTTNGPAYTSVISQNGSSFSAHGTNATSTAYGSAVTGLTDAVLKTDGTCTLRQGDMIGITTSGTFTASANLMVTVYVREDNGVY